MGEISTLLQERVHLSAEQADSAENEVLAFVRSRVPEQYQGILDSILGSHSGSGTEKAAGDVLGGLGGLVGAAEGMFGGHKE